MSNYLIPKLKDLKKGQEITLSDKIKNISDTPHFYLITDIISDPYSDGTIVCYSTGTEQQYYGQINIDKNCKALYYNKSIFIKVE